MYLFATDSTRKGGDARMNGYTMADAVKFLLGLLMAISMAFVSMVTRANDSRVDRLENSLIIYQQQVSELSREVAAARADIASNRRQLDRIESKLDRALP